MKRVVRRRPGPVPPAERPTAPPAVCPLCDRPLVPGPSVDEHHLVPRSHGGKAVALVHRICHQKIHATLSESELARHYHTWNRLRTHEAIATFVEWVRKKPPQYFDRSRWPRERRRR